MKGASISPVPRSQDLAVFPQLPPLYFAVFYYTQVPGQGGFGEDSEDYLHSENCNQNIWTLPKHLEPRVLQTTPFIP